MSYSFLLHNKRGQLGEVGRELLTSSHVIANLDAAVYQQQQGHQRRLPEGSSDHCVHAFVRDIYIYPDSYSLGFLSLEKYCF